MIKCSQHSLFLYKTISKSRIIKTFEMDRRKLQRTLRILILLQQMRRIKRPKQKKKKRCWVRDIFKNRERLGAFETFHEMRNDRDLLLRYFRMSPERFDHLLTLVREEMRKKMQLSENLSRQQVGSQKLYVIWDLVKRSSPFYTVIVSGEALYQPPSRRHVKQSIMHSKIVI